MSQTATGRQPHWRLTISVALMLLAAGAVLTLGLSSPGAAESTGVHQASTPTTTVASLVNQQTEAAIDLAQAQAVLARQQAASAKAGDSFWRQIITPLGGLVAALVTAGVAFLAFLLPLRRQQKEDAKAKIAAVANDVAQQEKDRIQRFDAGFAAAVIALGQDNAAVQAGGAAALQSYLRPEMVVFHDQVFGIVRANLDQGIDHPDPVRSLLVTTLTKMLRDTKPAPLKRHGPPRKRSSGRGDGIDLARTWLKGADLRNVDLSSADLAFSDLSNARLDGACLRRSWGWQVNLEKAFLRDVDLEEARFQQASAPSAIFDDANLVSARFEKATLNDARFRGATLQGAHFNHANLQGADFRDANLKDTHFEFATFDVVSDSTFLLSSTYSPLRSPKTKEPDRRLLELQLRLHTDPATAERLLALAQVKRSGASSAPADAPTPGFVLAPDRVGT